LEIKKLEERSKMGLALKQKRRYKVYMAFWRRAGTLKY